MPAIASSDPEPEVAARPPRSSVTARLLRSPSGLEVALLVVVGALLLGWLMTSVHRPGHYWGDDFALYLRQADSVFGDPAVRDVIDDNHYMLDHSEQPDFSPPLYPWGWPLLLALPVAVVGIDVDALALVSVTAFLVAVAAWFALARPRLGTPLAVGGAAVVALSPVYVSWTGLLHSELPFMAAAFGTLAWLDRCRRGWTTATGTVVVLGLLAAAAFSIRREGLALLGAVGVAQLLDGAIRDLRAAERRGAVAWRLATPYAAFVGAVALLQAALPSTLLPSYDGTSVTNLFRFSEQYLTAFGDALGPGGRTWGVALVVFAAIGFAWRVVSAPRDDLPLLTYLVAVALIGGSFFIPSSRYVATVTPLLWYGALQVPALLRATVERVARPAARSRLAGVVTVSAVCLVGALVWHDVRHLRDTARIVDSYGERVTWGPVHPHAEAMFDEVRATTEPDDVIGFFKARAMTRWTGRRAIQVGESRSPLVEPARMDVVVMNRDDRWFDDVEACPAWFTATWSNPRFVVYRVLDASDDAPSPGC